MTGVNHRIKNKIVHLKTVDNKTLKMYNIDYRGAIIFFHQSLSQEQVSLLGVQLSRS